MRRFRRSFPPGLRESHAAFEDVLAVLEPAKARLTHVVPTTRVPGRPLEEAMAEFVVALDRAQLGMASWRHPDVERWWRECDAGIREARERSRRVSGEPLGFESLIWIVEQLLDPLDPFAETDRRFSELRVRGR